MGVRVIVDDNYRIPGYKVLLAYRLANKIFCVAVNNSTGLTVESSFTIVPYQRRATPDNRSLFTADITWGC